MPLRIDARVLNGAAGGEPCFEKFRIDWPGRVRSVGHHLDIACRFRCLIRTISMEGAELEVPAFYTVPRHFFLSIQGIRDEIGATLVNREREQLTVSFNMLIDPGFLDTVIRLSRETGS